MASVDPQPEPGPEGRAVPPAPVNNPQAGENFILKSMRFGSGLFNRGAAFVQEGTRSLVDDVQTLLSATGKFGSKTAEIVGGAFERVLLSAGALAHEGLEELGTPPETQGYTERGVRIALGLLPIIGDAQDYAQARTKYKAALALEDPQERGKGLHEARRDCLICATAASIQLVTLPLTGPVAIACKAGKYIFSALNLGKSVRENTERSSWCPKINLDVLSGRADQALGYAPIRDAMDYLLKFEFKSDNNNIH